ncbi:hypothetical protein WDW37_21205 [Bdellovibrionota bacterium FG-1]
MMTWLNPQLQEVIVFGIVAIAVLGMIYRFYRKSVAGPVARWLLKRGKVGLAMSIRGHEIKASGCDSCPAEK